jgi:hypothetical protein
VLSVCLSDACAVLFVCLYVFLSAAKSMLAGILVLCQQSRLVCMLV